MPKRAQESVALSRESPSHKDHSIEPYRIMATAIVQTAVDDFERFLHLSPRVSLLKQEQVIDGAYKAVHDVLGGGVDYWLSMLDISDEVYHRALAALKAQARDVWPELLAAQSPSTTRSYGPTNSLRTYSSPPSSMPSV